MRTGRRGILLLHLPLRLLQVVHREEPLQGRHRGHRAKRELELLQLHLQDPVATTSPTLGAGQLSSDAEKVRFLVLLVYAYGIFKSFHSFTYHSD